MDNTKKIKIEYYTDPLCCWSWSFEPQWRKLRYEYSDSISWKYVMGGMLTDWTTYNDTVNSISKPSQMGPLWKEARHVSGMPINDKIWVEHPPRSSYPACLAVKAAELQGLTAGDRLLRKIREAVMLRMMDVSDKQVLLQVALELREEYPDALNYTQFERDISSKRSINLLKADLRKVRSCGISRYPSLVFRKKGKKKIIVTGYRPYHELVETIYKIQSDIMPANSIRLQDYKKQWGNLTAREMAEVEGTAKY
ncbi:DsbA family protein [Fulvivirga ulvae]|uniref:DsbA family protein n=1 Tax=Fulvivirga ulvae TaxID=2904245 RepID=UPI001F2FE633|nr:DsbA family protein [Fulvivirga ulvae]UII31431.1 DsbA family protein [Fulvivirga ulvae]